MTMAGVLGSQYTSATSTRLAEQLPSAVILSDRQRCIPLNRVLGEDDVILLLTPVVIHPEPEMMQRGDPFEPLGRALSQQHRSVRHVPYTKSSGITGVHVAFVKRAKVVIFVVTDLGEIDGVSQLRFAEMVNILCETGPTLVVACCCGKIGADLPDLGFPTLIQISGFSGKDLDALAHLLLTEDMSYSSPSNKESSLSSGASAWQVQTWDYDRDIDDAHRLWIDSIPTQFHLDRQTFGSLLRRDGYAMHHVVRDLSFGMLLGFCATYITFADSSGDRLIGSIAVIMVREDRRGQGIGRILHDAALGQLHRIRGVGQIQLGSTFPRLLYGLPRGISDTDWFRRRGWVLDETAPGRGRVLADWILMFSALPQVSLASAGLNFRPCELADAHRVIGMVSQESEKKMTFGWYDQYAKIIDSTNMSDIIIGFEGSTLVATAITYTPSSQSPAARDIPWAGALGENIGGVTCICIKGIGLYSAALGG